jgi:hypothetical protein
MTDIPPELGAPQPQQGGSLREQLAPLQSGDPVEAFIAELMSIAQEAGILDQSFQEETVEDRTDLQDTNANPLEFLNEQQMVRLVDLFLAIPPEQRGPLMEQIKAELPPNAAKQVDAIIRFAQQRGAGQGGQVVQEQPQI